MKGMIQATFLGCFLLAADASALEVIMEARVLNAKHPVVKARTNLPESTKVSVVVRSESTGFFVQVDTKVEKGSVEAGPFDQNGVRLPPGLYISEIETEPAYFQPDSVQKVIGERGQHLEGKLIQRGMLGGRLYLRADFSLL